MNFIPRFGQPAMSPGGYGGGFSDVRSQIAQAMMPQPGMMPQRPMPAIQPRMGIGLRPARTMSY